jgi:Pyridoxal-dependent decarboxylase conserved domain
VDGAFGLWAAASRATRHLGDGVELADSWATDAHKWLNVPYDCGLAFVADPAAQQAALAKSASYLVAGEAGERDPDAWTPESSRRARGLPVWAALRSLGRSGVAELVDRCCRHARRFAGGAGGDPDARTREVVRRVQQDGICWLGGTSWHGMAAMRISVSNWSTTEEDVDRSIEAILRAAATV